MERNEPMQKPATRRRYSRPLILEDVPLETQSVVCDPGSFGKATSAGGCVTIRT